MNIFQSFAFRDTQQTTADSGASPLPVAAAGHSASAQPHTSTTRSAAAEPQNPSAIRSSTLTVLPRPPAAAPQSRRGERQSPAATVAGPSPQSQLQCGVCGLPVRGVFVRVSGDVPVHATCMKCVACGLELRGRPFFYVREKLYCETHVKQLSRPADSQNPSMFANALF